MLINDGGALPLDVMIETMREYWAKSQKAADQAERANLMVQACAIAKDAAPYVHPRLTNVQAAVRHISDVKDLSDTEIIAIIGTENGTDGSQERTSKLNSVH